MYCILCIVFCKITIIMMIIVIIIFITEQKASVKTQYYTRT